MLFSISFCCCYLVKNNCRLEIFTECSPNYQKLWLKRIRAWALCKVFFFLVKKCSTNWDEKTRETYNTCAHTVELEVRLSMMMSYVINLPLVWISSWFTYDRTYHIIIVVKFNDRRFFFFFAYSAVLTMPSLKKYRDLPV